MYLSNNIIDIKQGNYSFSDYFKMNITPQNLSKVFGYRFQIDVVNFKQEPLNHDFNHFVQDFHKNLNAVRQKINLNSEMAKREFLLAPIIYELVKHIDIQVEVEANTYFDQTLKGSIDYVLNNKNNIFIAIEAKNSDLEKGIVQLVSELIAIDKLVKEPSEFIYGAVTIGFSWCFVVLARQEQQFTQHIDYFSIKELDTILKILLGILK